MNWLLIGIYVIRYSSITRQQQLCSSITNDNLDDDELDNYCIGNNNSVVLVTFAHVLERTYLGLLRQKVLFVNTTNQELQNSYIWEKLACTSS